jgi:hypothetical protein
MSLNPILTKNRIRAATIHLGLSLALAALAGLLVFFVWYPYPYRELSGGRELFLLLVSVDVVMGPLLTLAVFDTRKPLKELRRDVTMIAALQLAALGYGLWTVAIARPVHLVFEIDRFRVVHAIDVPPELLARAPLGLRQLPLTGPTLLSVRDFRDAKESFDATMAALQGAALGARPDLWQDYGKARPQVLTRARSVGELKARFPSRVRDIDNAIESGSVASRKPNSVGYIPMIGRQTFWTVLIDTNTAEVITFVPIDSF